MIYSQELKKDIQYIQSYSTALSHGQKVQCILGVLVLTPYCYVYLNFVLVVKPGVASASEEGSCLFRT